MSNPDETGRVFSSRKNHLFVIGIDKYQKISPLSNCVSDATSFKNTLIANYKFEENNAVSLFDKKATKGAILSNLEKYSQTLTARDNLILFFAGHGYYKKQNGIGYLIPVEGKASETWDLIPHSTILDYVKGMKVHHLLLIIDSCYSGNLLRSDVGEEKILPKGAKEAYALEVDVFPSRWGMAAGRIETVADGLVGDASPYAKGLITFLESTPQKVFAASDLMYHVNRIASYNADQTPIGGPMIKMSDQGGEFLFERRGADLYQIRNSIERKVDTGGNRELPPRNISQPPRKQESVSVRVLIMTDELEEALEILRAKASGRDADTLLLLTARLNALNRDKLDGVISESDYQIGRNRIRASLLEMEKRIN
ncbi:MAG: caspase family protein [Bacteroidota bacterium]